ncbi:MAG: hypothetical protein IT359_09090 [Gemmatimonadaceae bacterium]|nr:hypothetical protein [Gemmatimonadaceae bacterium]
MTRLPLPLRKLRMIVALAALLGAPATSAGLRAQSLTAKDMKEGDVRERRAWYVSQRAGADGRLPADKVAALREFKLSARAGAFAPAIAGSSVAAGERWQPMGPSGFISMNTRYSSSPMQDEGRFSTVALHPTDARVMLAGAGSAGVWRTLNGGASWQALGDNECSTAIGHIVMDPVDPNIVYAGTGETFDPQGYTDGCGILKSTNGGTTWSRVAATILAPAGALGGFVYHLAVDRATAGTVANTTVLAATNFGLLRSTNSGQSWSIAMQGFVTDVVQHPTRPEVWYAAVGNLFGAAANGVYMSTNGGVSWTPIAQSLGTPTSLGRIALAVSPARPGSVWAIIANPSNRAFRTLARWDEFSGQWTLLAANGITFQQQYDEGDFGEQSEYNLVLAVDPIDENKVIIGGVRLFRSRDGGNTFNVIAGNVHSDWHSVVFDANDSRRIVATCDGGIFTSTDGGTSWRTLNNGISATQFYPGIAVHPTNPAVVVGGTQDNGSMMSGGSMFWSGVGYGDGGYAMIDYTSPNTVLVSWQGGQLGKLDVNARTLTYIPPRFVYQPPFITPFAMDPNNPRQLWAGTRAIERSQDLGASWVAFSPTVNANINALAIGRGSPQVIFGGTTNGFIFWTPNGGTSWFGGTQVQRAVTDVAADPYDTKRFAITHGGYGGFKILLTPDAGTNFANLTGNLPDIPINAFAFTPTRNRFFVGTDLGVFETVDGGVSWTLTQGLSFVAVTDLVYHAASNRLVAGTYGRGIWSLPLTSEPPVLRGDVDRNGLVNAADALLIQRGLAAIPLPSPLTVLPHGDANCSGALDATDPLIVLRYAVGLGTQGTCVSTSR